MAFFEGLMWQDKRKERTNTPPTGAPYRAVTPTEAQAPAQTTSTKSNADMGQTTAPAATTYDPGAIGAPYRKDLSPESFFGNNQTTANKAPAAQTPTYKINEDSPFANAARFMLDGDENGLSNEFKRFSTIGDPLYTPYITATNVDALTTFGQLVGEDFSNGISTDRYDFWADYFESLPALKRNPEDGKYTSPNTVYGTSKSAKASAAYKLQQSAYLFNNVMTAEKKTRSAEDEYQKLQKQVDYWVGRTDLNLSDKDIIGMLDMSGYKTLTGMGTSAAAGGGTRLNRAVPYSEQLLTGMIWAARNKDNEHLDTSDAVTNAIFAAAGIGNSWQYDDTINPYLTIGDERYNPYQVKSTMDDLCMKYGVTSFDQEWLNANAAELSKTEQGNKDYTRIKNALDRTNNCRAEAEGIRGWIDYQIETGGTVNFDNPSDADYVFGTKLSYFDKDGNSVEVKPAELKKLMESLGDNGAGHNLLDTTGTIDFSMSDLRKYYARKKNETPEFDAAYASLFGELEGYSTSEMVDDEMDKTVKKFRNVILENGDNSDKALEKMLGGLTDPDKKAAFVEEYVTKGLLTKKDAAFLNFRITEQLIADDYAPARWNVSVYENAEQSVKEAKDMIAFLGLTYDPGFTPEQYNDMKLDIDYYLTEMYDYAGDVESGRYTPIKSPMSEAFSLAGTREDKIAYLKWAYDNADAQTKADLDYEARNNWLDNQQQGFKDMLDLYNAGIQAVPYYARARRGEKTMQEYAGTYDESKAKLEQIAQEREDAMNYAIGVFGTPVVYEDGTVDYAGHMITFGMERIDQMLGATQYVLGIGGKDVQPFAAGMASQYSLILNNNIQEIREQYAEKRGIPVEQYTDDMAKADALSYMLDNKKSLDEARKNIDLVDSMLETYGIDLSTVGAMTDEENKPYDNYLKYRQEVLDAGMYFENMELQAESDFDETVANVVAKQFGNGISFVGRALNDEQRKVAEAFASILDENGKLPEKVAALIDDKTAIANMERIGDYLNNSESVMNEGRGRMSAEDGMTVLYLYGKGRDDEAEQFKAFVDKGGYGTMRNAAVETEEYRQYANANPVLASIGTVIAAPAQIIGAGYAIFQRVTGQEIDANAEAFSASRYITTTRGQIGENIQASAGDYGEFWKWFYDTAMSSLDSMYNGAIMGTVMGPAMSGTGRFAKFLRGEGSNRALSFFGKAFSDFSSASLMGMEAAGTAIWNAKLNGADDDTALSMGVATFMSETVTEAFTVENVNRIFKVGGTVEGLRKGFVETIKDTFKSMPSESLSEIVAEIGEKYFDYYFMGENSEFNRAIESYVTMGYNYEDARAKAVQDAVHDIALAGASGMLMAGQMGAISMVQNGMRTAYGTIRYGHDEFLTRTLAAEGTAISKNVSDLEDRLSKAKDKNKEKDNWYTRNSVKYLEGQLREARKQETENTAKQMNLIEYRLNRGTGMITEIENARNEEQAERERVRQESEQALANAGMGVMETVNADTAARPLTIETINQQTEEAETRMSEAKVSAAEAEATAQAEADQAAESAEKTAREAREKALAKLQRQTDKIIQNANQRRDAAIQAANKLTGEEKQKAIDTANRRAETTIKGANTRLQNGTANIENQLQTQLEYIANQRDASYQNAAETRRTAEAEADRILEETRSQLNQQREQALAEQERTRETAEAHARKNGAAQVEANAKAEADRIAKETTEALARQNLDDRDDIEARRAATIKSINENKSLNDHARERSRERANARFDRMQERVEAEYQQKIKAVQDEKNSAYARAEADRAQAEVEADEILKRSAVPINPNAAMAPVNQGGVQHAPAAVVQQEAQATDALNGIQADMEKFQQLVDGLAHQMTSGDQEAVNAALAQLRQVSGDTNALINVIKAGLQRQVDETQTSPNAERMAQVKALDEVYKRMQALIDFMGEGEATATTETSGQEAQPIPETEGNPVPTGGTVGEMEAPALEENAGPSEEMVEQEQPAPMQDVPAPAAEETMDQAEEDNEDKSLIDFVNDFKNAVGNALDTIRGALTYARDNSAESAKTDAETAARAKVLDLYSGMKDLIDQMKGWYATYQAGLKKKDNAKADRAQTEFGNLFKQLQEMWKNYVDATGTYSMNSAGLDANGNLLGDTNAIPGTETGNQSADPVATAIAVLNRAQSTGNRGTQFAATQAVMNNRNEGNTDTVAIARAGAATQSMFSLFGTDGTIQGLKHVFGSAFVSGMDMSGVRGAITTLALTGEQGNSVLRQLFEGRMDLPSAVTSAAQIAGQNVNAAILQKKVEAYQTGIEMRRLIGQGGLESTLGARNNLRTANQNLEAAEAELDAKIQDRENRYNELQDAMAEYDRASGMQERAPSQGGNANSGKQNALKDAAAAVAAASQNYGNAMSVVAEYQQKVSNARQAQRNAQKQYDDAVNGAMGKLRTQALANVRQANAENTARLAEEKAARGAQAAEAVAQAEQNVRDVADAARAEAVRTMAEAEQGRAERAAGNAENAERTGEAQANSSERTNAPAVENGEAVSEIRDDDGIRRRAAGEGGRFDPATTEENGNSGPVKSGTQIMTDWLDKIGMKYETSRRRYRKDMRGTTRGYVNPATGIVHVWDTTDMEAAMHEVAHVLDYKFHLFESADTQRMIDKMSKIPGWRAWLDSKYAEEERPGEAVAEAVSMWMVDRQNAMDVCGEEFIRNLESMMDKEGWLKATLEMKEEWKQNRESGSVGRAMGTIALMDKYREFKEQAKRWKEVIFDHTNPLYRFSQEMRKKGQYKPEDNIRDLEKLRNRRTQNTMESFISLALTMPGTDELMVDSKGNAYGSISELLSKAKGKELELNTLMALEHAVDRQHTDVDMEKLSDEESAKLKASIKEVFGRDVDVNTALAKLREMHPELQPIADRFREMYNAIQYHWGVETGLIDKDTYYTERKRYPHYIPTFRVGESSHNSQAAATGSTKDIFNPIVAAMENIQKTVGEYYNQEVLRAFDRFMTNPGMDKMGIAEQVEEGSGKDIVTVKLEDGTVRKWAIKDDSILNALTYVRDDSIDGLIGKFLNGIGYVTRSMSALNTAWSVEFSGQNFAADTFSALITGDSALTPVDYFAHLLKSAGIYLTNQNKSADKMADVVRYYKMYAEMGTRYSYRNKQGVKDLRNKLYNSQHEGKINKLVDLLRHPLSTIENITGFFEDLTRFNEFRMAGEERSAFMQKLLGKNYQRADLTTEGGRVQAARQSADVTTDFGQSGSSDILTKLSKVIPFFNASAQGLYKTLRMFTKDNSGRRAFMAAKLVINSVILGAAVAALRGLTWDDDDKEAYDQLNAYEKAQYIHIKTGDGKFIRLRKSQDAIIGMAMATGEMIGSITTGLEDDPLSTFVKVGRNVIENALLDPTSNIFSPLITSSYNKTYFGSDIEDATMQGMDVLDRYDESDGAQPLYRALSALLNMANIEYSPADVKYHISQYTGSLGMIGTGLINNIVAYATGEYDDDLVTALTEPFIDKVASKFSVDPVYSNRLYQEYKSAAAYIANINAADKQGLDPAGLRLSLTETERKTALNTAKQLADGKLKTYDADMKKAWKEYYSILENDKLPKTEREERAREVRKKINEISIQYTALVNQYRTDYGYTTDFLKNAAGVITPWLPKKKETKKK